jgi:DNA polymerase zeta
MKLRLVLFDYYSAAPIPGLDPLLSPLDGCPVARVPILRVFGPTPGGQSVCLHLHHIFPYFFLRLPPDFPGLGHVSDYAMQLKLSLSRALDLSMKRSPGEQYVHDIVAVRGKPFYGFHEKEEMMLKGKKSIVVLSKNATYNLLVMQEKEKKALIEQKSKVLVYQPGLVTKMADLLRSGALLNHNFEVLEAHVPYRLQACIDLNLYGMDMIELSKFWFRQEVPQQAIKRASGAWLRLRDEDSWIAKNVPGVYVMEGRTKLSSCMLEVDSSSEFVVNTARMLRSPPSTQSQVPLVKSLAVLWEEEAARRGGAMPAPTPVVGNALTDELQFREGDRLLREKLEQLVEGIVGHEILTGEVPEDLRGLCKANEIGVSSEAHNSQPASAFSHASLSEGQIQSLVNEDLVEALLRLGEDDNDEKLAEEEAKKEQEAAEAELFFQDLALSQSVEEELQEEHEHTGNAVAAEEPQREQTYVEEEDAHEEEDDFMVLLDEHDFSSSSQRLVTLSLAAKPPSAAELAGHPLPFCSPRPFFSVAKDVLPRVRAAEHHPTLRTVVPFAPGHGARLAQLADATPLASKQIAYGVFCVCCCCSCKESVCFHRYKLALRPPSAAELAVPEGSARTPARASLGVSQVGTAQKPKWEVRNLSFVYFLLCFILLCV